MSSGRFPRKLAAILHADVAGYSRLTEQDEEGTHLRVLHYKRVMAEQVHSHNGHVVDSEGDSLLADFPSASSALICALGVQESLARLNVALPEQRQVRFRIGINLSEVNVDTTRQRLFGYGVNVAARLESLATPGGVCVSESMQEAVADTLPVNLQYLGARAVKNISQPIRAFQISLTPGATLPQPTHHPTPLEGEREPLIPTTGSLSAKLHTIAPESPDPISPVAFQDSRLNPSANTSVAVSLTQRLFARLLHEPLSRSVHHITHDPGRRELVAQALDSPPRDTGIAIHSGFLKRWLRWNQFRFGSYRTNVWKLFDFCFLHAFIYSPLFFFIGLIFLQGDPYIGELRVSWLEVGPQALPNPNPDPQLLPGEAGTLPLLLFLLAIYALADRLWRRGHTAHEARVFNARRFALWLVLSSVIAFALALNGFGAGLVALAVAIGASFLRNMPGAGLMYGCTAAIVILALNTIVVGAEAGQPIMQSIARDLDDLVGADIDRFLLLWTVFPVVNALFDTLSWRVSRRLGLALRFGQSWSNGFWFSESKRNQSTARRPTLAGYWLSTLVWGLLDLGIALLLLAGAATGVGASLELFDYFRQDYTGYYAPADVIDALTSDPLGQGFWLTAMLVTTLIPTMLHLMAIGSGLLSTLAWPIEQGTRLSTILMYGPAHPLFDIASRQAARLRLMSVIRTVVLACAWMALLGWLVVSMLNSGLALHLLATSLSVGQQFAAIMIDMMR